MTKFEKLVAQLVSVPERSSGVYQRYSHWGSGTGFGSKKAIEAAEGRLRAQLAMFHGEPYACTSPRRSNQVNVYGVSGQVLCVRKDAIEEVVDVLQEFKPNNKLSMSQKIR